MNLLENKIKYKSQTSIGTISIILINAIVFILLYSGVILDETLLLNPNVSIVLEKPWTIITVFFAHENVLHLIANMLLFYWFGKALEELKGTRVVLSIYLLAGILGSVGALLLSQFSNNSEPLLGASAAVFGVVSAVGVIAPTYRIFNTESKLLKSLFSANAMQFTLILFGINILLYVSNPSMPVSSVVHTIGLLVGAIWGLFIKD